MNQLLRLSGLIDHANTRIGKSVIWLVLIVSLISAANAVVRYLFNASSNAFLEIQWYLFAAIFLLSAGYTLLQNEHVRIDVISGRFSPRVHAWIDILGTLFFLLPMAITIMHLSWPMFINALDSGEMSSSPGGLIRWPARLLVPVGFFLLVMQGFSELIKRIAFLQGLIDNPLNKHKEMRLEEELAEAIKAQASGIARQEEDQ
jgi:TRAP-type mannitol/chloroaromatic compound transport system permease small subunit